jgi:hypothetical protein
MSTAATPIKDPGMGQSERRKSRCQRRGPGVIFLAAHDSVCARRRHRREQLAAFPFLKHLGIYGYRRETLLRLVKFPVSPLESAEKLEQLRALENGIGIAVVKVDYDSVGVDVPADVKRVENFQEEGRLKFS